MNANELAEKAAQQAGVAQERMREVGAKGAAMGRKAKGVARDAGAAADLYLHEYAWTTVVVVGLISGIVGYMLGRKS